MIRYFFDPWGGLYTTQPGHPSSRVVLADRDCWPCDTPGEAGIWPGEDQPFDVAAKEANMLVCRPDANQVRPLLFETVLRQICDGESMALGVPDTAVLDDGTEAVVCRRRFWTDEEDAVLYMLVYTSVYVDNVLAGFCRQVLVQGTLRTEEFFVSLDIARRGPGAHYNRMIGRLERQ